MTPKEWAEYLMDNIWVNGKNLTGGQRYDNIGIMEKVIKSAVSELEVYIAHLESVLISTSEQSDKYVDQRNDVVRRAEQAVLAEREACLTIAANKVPVTRRNTAIEIYNEIRSRP